MGGQEPTHLQDSVAACREEPDSREAGGYVQVVDSQVWEHKEPEPTYRYQGKLQVRTNLPLSRETSGQGSIQHARLGMPSTGRFCDDFGPITAKIPLNFQVFFLE